MKKSSLLYKIINGIWDMCYIWTESYVQYSLFDDPKQTDKERHLQEAVLNVKQRYGKNAIMRGSNLLECSTYRERNEQVGGHRA